MLKKIVALAFCLIMLMPSTVPAGQVKALRVTVLSTMLADQGLGEWGYSALVDVDRHKFLFDTGARPRRGVEECQGLKSTCRTSRMW